MNASRLGVVACTPANTEAGLRSCTLNHWEPLGAMSLRNG